MKTTTVVTRTFEPGDMFIFIDTSYTGASYKRGDFLLIELVHSNHFQFTTGATVTGKIGAASGTADWLSRELDAGALEYQGNVKVGV